MVNVMGDALATGIMAHICRKDFMKEGDGVSFNSGLSPILLFKTQNHVHFPVSLNVRVNNILPRVTSSYLYFKPCCPQVPLICETNPPRSTPPLMNCHNNGRYRPPSSGIKHKFIPSDVAQLMKLEEGVLPQTDKKKPPVPPRHLKKSKEHCTIDMNGFETNV